jgi:hypothetical protein
MNHMQAIHGARIFMMERGAADNQLWRVPSGRLHQELEHKDAGLESEESKHTCHVPRPSCSLLVAETGRPEPD